MSQTYRGLPEHIQGGVQRYIENGITPGDFLQAVICNNLKESFMYADDINVVYMHEIVNWFYNYAPGVCWGSWERMEKWCKQGGLVGREKKVKEVV